MNRTSYFQQIYLNQKAVLLLRSLLSDMNAPNPFTSCGNDDVDDIVNLTPEAASMYLHEWPLACDITDSI